MFFINLLFLHPTWVRNGVLAALIGVLVGLIVSSVFKAGKINFLDLTSGMFGAIVGNLILVAFNQGISVVEPFSLAASQITGAVFFSVSFRLLLVLVKRRSA